jgi:hypothetical protein
MGPRSHLFLKVKPKIIFRKLMNAIGIQMDKWSIGYITALPQ